MNIREFFNKTCKSWTVMRRTPNYWICSGVERVTGQAVYIFAAADTGSAAIDACLKNYKQTSDLKSVHLLRAVDMAAATSAPDVLVFIYPGADIKPFAQAFSLPFNIDRFLCLAGQSAALVRDLHQAGLTLTCMTPDFLFYHQADDRLLAADLCFQPAIWRCPEQQDPLLLSWISPEQTGRMNRSPDYRSDFYILGTLFYQWLVGKPLFSGSDRLEMIHAHIARMPLTPASLNHDIPCVISEIVMKLLHKSPEDRYQSALGLYNDINICLQMLAEQGRINDFTLAEYDVPEQIELSFNLYEREAEFRQLSAGYEQVRGGAAVFMVVSGPSGIGKSCLVQALSEPVNASGGIFITGKYDALQITIPYHALIQALGSAARFILRQNTARIAQQREKLNTALGENGQILIDFVPEFAAVIGSQPSIAETTPFEARNRFKLVFEQTLKALSAKDQPLVLFLDDIQWADSDSLDLLHSFLTEYESAYIYVILGYREDSGNMSDDWLRLVSAIPGKGVIMASIAPKPLSQSAIVGILSDVLYLKGTDLRQQSAVVGLAELMLAKTGGNPFFVHRFLHEIYAENLLYYDFTQGNWRWDLAQIRRRNISDNIINLLCRALDELPLDTRRVLQSAACFGNVFDVETISYIAQKNIADTLNDLAPALRAQYVRIPNPAETMTMEFVHDRVRQAVYSTIPESQKEACHRQIGEILLHNNADQYTQDQFFFIINHLNLGNKNFSDEADQHRLAELNLMAGIKARKATAYQSARLYLRLAADLSGTEAWDKNYALSLSIFPRLAECEYLCGNFEQAEALFTQTLNRVTDKIDKARIYTLKIDFHTHLGQVGQAVALAIEGLSLFDIKLPRHPSKAVLIRAFIQAAARLYRRKIEHISQLPVMQNPEYLAVVSLLSRTGTAAFYCHPRLFALIIMFGVSLGLKHGVTEALPMALVSFGLIIGAGLGRYELGYRLGQAALSLTERFDDKEHRARTYFTFVYFIPHWRRHVRENLHFFRIARQGALQTGDLSFVGHSINSETLYRLMAGDHLDELFTEYIEARELIQRTREPFIQHDYRDNLRFYDNLKGVTRSRDSLDGDGYDQSARLAQLEQENNRLALFLHLLLRLKMLFLAGKYRESIAVGESMEPLADAPRGTLHEAEYVFFYALAQTAGLPAGSFRRRLTKSIEHKRLNQMKVWTEHCPDNFSHKYLLMAAENARIKGQSLPAAALYLRACAAAKEQGYIQNEAIAHELAANFHADQQQLDLAAFHLQQAYRGYQRWGASAKAADIKNRYESMPNYEPVSIPSLPLLQPDMDAVITLLQAVSTEIVMDKLLKRIIQTVMELAGADLIVFLSVKDGKCFMEAEKKADSELIAIYDSVPADEREDVFLSVINYVCRTGIRQVFDDASRHPAYSADAYVKQNHPKSVLCLPVIRQTILTAVLYLENTMATGAFTENRCSALHWLASQFAISFENARLYEQMRKTEKELRELEEALKYRLECERLISSVSSIIMTSPPDRIPEALDRALKALGEFVGEDRCYLFQLSPDGRYANETNEWCAAGVDSKISDFQHLCLADFPWLTQKMYAFEIVHIAGLDELPESAANLKQFLEIRDVHSFVLIPMITSNELIGFVGFEAVRQKKNRESEQIRLLRTVSDIVANACAGVRIENERMMYQEHLRSMSMELSLTEERERRRIAVELHDRIGHALANCAMKLGALKSAAVTSEQQFAWKSMKKLIDQSIKDTHTLTFELSPPILYDLGLEAAIDWLVEQTVEAHGLTIDVEDDMAYKPLDHGFRVLLFQAVRELLFNIVKHAQAEHVLIEIRKIKEQLCIIIQDDGIGFDLAEKPSSDKIGGFGLFSIRERLKHQGGGFEITTALGKGVRIALIAPIMAEQ